MHFLSDSRCCIVLLTHGSDAVLRLIQLLLCENPMHCSGANGDNNASAAAICWMIFKDAASKHVSDYKVFFCCCYHSNDRPFPLDHM